MSVAVESHADAGQPMLPMPVRPPTSPVAVALLTQAQQGFAQAGRETGASPRFIAYYSCALRAAAAVLAARGRPHRGRARPASAWVLLETTAPELTEWAAYFAANSAAHAAAQAGNTRQVTAESADELMHRTTEFLELAHRAVHGTPEVPTPRAATCPGGMRGLRKTRSR